jgi:class 3 adenylate cyclase
MEGDEDDTHTWLMRLQSQVLDPGIAAEGGRLVKSTGDGFMAIFDRAADAMRCAVGLQRALAAATVEQTVERRISFRTAVNVADVIMEPDDVYGDGVNVAARLQGYAEPGGPVVSGAVVEQL